MRKNKYTNDRLLPVIAAILACAVFMLQGCTVPASSPAMDQSNGHSPSYADGIEITSGIHDPIDAGDDEANTTQVVLPDGTVLDMPDPGSNEIQPYVDVNGGIPYFDETDRSRTDPFEDYSELDGLGRCGTAYANICVELMPTEDRGEIGSVRPSGWHTVKYNDLISGNYLYNRCHLIGFQLAGENANEKNLITGTRYLNIDGMLDHENAIADYVDANPENHVLYRVTPIYEGDQLVAKGVLMEAWSVEDGGSGICFCLFAWNVQPGIGINYETGDSWRLDGKDPENPDVTAEPRVYVLNANSGKFHLPNCKYAESISEENRLELVQTLDAMLSAGYSPCGSCHPDEEY